MLSLYNSLSRKKEEFVPYGEVVKMYSCGPTVYSYPHIGNMRAYIFMDNLRRTIKYNGFKIDGVMNITDVGHLTSDEDEGEDKMEVASKREKKSPYEIAEYYTNIFMEDLNRLNIDIPEHITKATEYIDKMIKFIKILEDKGYTYMLDDGLYFDVMKFKGYGMLSNKDMNASRNSRIEENENKHHPFDFALWKIVSPNHIMKWDSPWGVGCPGWHIECSVMSNDILGENIDIHTGGVDHKSVHHENEIAQNDCAMGHRVVKRWMHCEFLMVDGGKMSKSLNNIYTLKDLEERGYSSLDFKFFCLNSNYRKTINFTFDALDSARSARKSLKKMLLEHKNSDRKISSEKIDEYKKRLLDAVNDDLNTPLAIGEMFTILKEEASIDIYNLIIDFDKVLGLELDKEEGEEKSETPEEVVKMAEERWNAKLNKDYAKSDLLRNKLLDMGYEILDKRDGYEIKKQ